MLAKPLSFSVFVSFEALTLTELLTKGSLEFGTALGGTWITSVNVWLLTPAKLALEQLTVPPEPTEGVLHDQPLGALSETKVVLVVVGLSGSEFVVTEPSVSVKVALVAGSAPLLVTTMV